MLDINWIHDNCALFLEKQNARGANFDLEHILALDKNVRLLKGDIQDLQSRRNVIAKLKNNDEKVIEEARQVKNAILEKSSDLQKFEEELDSILLEIPNLIADDVPFGESELDNVEIRRFGDKKVFDFAPLSHYELCEMNGGLDFKTPAILSGARFSIVKDKLARLERGIVNFLLDCHTDEFGYREVSVPFLVKDIALLGTGQLPKFKDDLFKAGDGMWLIPTAEVYLTNLVRDQIVKSDDALPLRFVAATACFRSEAGAAGRDTRGLIRQHQFTKVELVSVTLPEDSDAEHERMTSAAEMVLQKLGLHYRVVSLCSRDIGFSAKKTYDIEVWIPGLDRYMEISSCSNCGDFQSRRMKARVKREGRNEFLHTLNGSGVAVGRLLIAIIENYQTNDHKIKIPEALHGYVPFKEI